MKKIVLIFLSTGFAMLTLSVNAQNALQKNPAFTENKGQVTDQNGQPRPDILFSCNTGGLVYHLRNGGISYQLNKVERWKEEKEEHSKAFKDFIKPQKVPAKTSVYRLDLEWQNANPQTTITKDEALPGFINYYNAICPNGITNLRSYKGVTYKNIYENIDLHYYFNGSDLKYDYIVSANADYKQIRIKIKGASRIILQKNGTLILQTPLGEITEAAPLVYQNKKQLPAKWNLKGDELSFLIQDYNSALPLLIDPLVRTWGTYYGGSGTDEGRGCTTDAAGNVYMTGRTNSGAAIATSGSFMNSLSGTNYDAYLVKFNSAGTRLWATYYGGADDDYGNACLADAAGNVYMTGQTGAGSNSGIASPGTGFQGFNAGGTDAFLVKFNSTGARLWGTYYGGANTDIGEALAIDPSSNIYMSGYSNSPNGFTTITSPGAHQTTVIGSAILIKFTSAGVRLWGTYYGDSPYSHGTTCATDASGNVYMAGVTDALNLISTPGAHQLSWVGLMDGFLVKFNSAGVRQWGTYYGDISYETINCCAVDAAGDVYVGGLAGSPTGIATPGSHQPIIGTALMGDGMLVKFSSAGVRQWGTYYGGTTDDYLTSCFIAPNGDICFGGVTNSSSGIASVNAFQPAPGGGTQVDGFMARMTSSGVRVWGSYYGGGANNLIVSCAGDNSGNIYMAGRSESDASVIVSPGSYQSVYGGGATDAFLVQFNECSASASPVNVTSLSNMIVCSGNSATLSATGTGTINWYNSPTSLLSLTTGSIFISPALSVGTVTYYAGSTSTCLANSLPVPVTVTVVALPQITINPASPGVCAGGTVALTASGANQYTWNTGATGTSITTTPASSTLFTLNGVSAQGCYNTASITVQVYVQPTINITVSNTLICAGNPATLTASGASQYTWNTGANGSAITIYPQNTISYTVTGKSTDGCSSIANKVVQVITCTGIEQVNESLSVNVFPNPFKETLNIQVPGPAEIRITDAIGQLLKQETLINLNTLIDLSQYAKGIYVVTIIQNKESKIFKIMKE